MHSACSQYTYRFIPHILNIQTDSFCYILSINRFILHIQRKHTAKLYLKICLVSQICTYFLYTHGTDSFRVFSVYGTGTYRFIPRIRRMHPNNLNVWNGINFFTAFIGILPQKNNTVCTGTIECPIFDSGSKSRQHCTK